METATMKNTDESGLEAPKAIGGWLILLCIGIIGAPIKNVIYFYNAFPPLFDDGTWEALTSVDSEHYSPLWGPLLISEMAAAMFFLASLLYIAFLFFKKKASFPKWYITITIFSIVYALVDAYVLTMILPQIKMFDENTVSTLLQSLIPLLIWAPYLIISKRSKATFTQ